MDRKLEERLDRIEKKITFSPRTIQLNYRMTASPLTEERETKYSPLTGTIKSAILHFPPGCNSLVEVFIFHKTKQILPEGRIGIALDGATQIFSINEPVKEKEPIEVRVINHDDTWEHTITCVIEIEGTPLEVVPVPRR